VGLDLEIGWMPKILMKSGNAQVQPGGNGYCDVGSVVSALEKSITPVDRSMGDVHPAGNPHFQLSPKALAEGAVVVAKTLSTQRPESAIFFQNNLVSFQKKMNELHNTINQKIQPLLKSSFAVIEYHKDFSYFLNSYNIPTFGSIEEKPGVPPSAARLASTALNAKKSQIRMALGSLYVPEKHLQKFSQISSIPFKKMPTMVQVDNEKFNSIEKVQHALADSLLQNLAE
jgi:zinc/manganese transport system substrate-binding protein